MTNGYHPAKGGKKAASKQGKTTKKDAESKKPAAKEKGKPGE